MPACSWRAKSSSSTPALKAKASAGGKLGGASVTAVVAAVVGVVVVVAAATSAAVGLPGPEAGGAGGAGCESSFVAANSSRTSVGCGC
jgi:hypothetical protein